jgi:hypothetical protein
MDQPTRWLPIKVFQGIRGVIPECQEYESTLESDHLTLLRFVTSEDCSHRVRQTTKHGCVRGVYVLR